MTNIYMLNALSDISDEYIMEAQVMRCSSTRKAHKHSPLLIAAVIGLLLLLVGCAAIYVLKIQDFTIGEKIVSEPVFAEKGFAVKGYEDVTYNVLTLSGVKGSANYQAALEWQAFKEEYDPHYEIMDTLLKNRQWPTFPEKYDAYSIYSEKMQKKLDEILISHNLRPAGARLKFRSMKNLYDALGVAPEKSASNGVNLKLGSGYAMDGGFVVLGLDFVFPNANGTEKYATWGNLKWCPKDSFDSDIVTLNADADWTQWSCSAKNGNYLIVRSAKDWRAYILCDKGDAMLSVMVETTSDATGQWDNHCLTDRQLEEIATAIDENLFFKSLTKADVAAQASLPTSHTQDGFTAELKSIQTDGYMAYITFTVTAPEGVSISSGHTEDGLSFVPEYISMKNAENESWEASGFVGTSEDNDEKSNTVDLVYTVDAEAKNEKIPFAPGTRWIVHMENFVTSHWDEAKMAMLSETRARGEWQFEIDFTEDSGDYREIELLDKPIVTKASVGWTPEGADLFENVTISSFKLRSTGANVTLSHDNADLCYIDGSRIWAVMKDGSRTEMGGTGGFIQAQTPLNLDEVAYVLLADGTILSMPE